MRKRGKITAIVLTVCLLLVMVPAGVMAASGFSLIDIVQFAKAMAGSGNLTASQQQAYDINGDGKLDILDLALMAESLLGTSGTSSQPAATTAPGPAVCANCHQYPCVCSTSQACSVCGLYNCAGHHHSGSTVVTPSAWTCGTCHSYPCVCHSASQGTSSGTAVSGGHHHGWSHH